MSLYPDVYNINGYVWATTSIHVGKLTIPRSTRGQIKDVQGLVTKKYTVVWEGFPGVKTTVAAKFIATN